MERPFDCFVMFAEMRTGSNYLESNLNAIEGIECHGEAFNPHFIGYPNKSDILGINRAMRDADPGQLISAIKERSGGVGGFRFFHDHDPRVPDFVLEDRRCAKIVLTRNPIESYVSWKIAQATGQWKITNIKRRRETAIRFDVVEFEHRLGSIQAFQLRLLNRLQSTGQTAFYIAYEDLQNLEVINGLARFLGCPNQLEALDETLKPQNPGSLKEKVANFGEMEKALSDLDLFNLFRTPNFEPRRGPAVPGFVAGVRAPLLYMPMRGGPEREVRQWFGALDGVSPDELITKLNQKALRQWMERRPGHRRFTVLRHPVARAHWAFCNKILNDGPGCLREIRKTLRNVHKLPIPGDGPDKSYDLSAHREAFLAFLAFVKMNLAGQTGLRVDPHWATQSSVLEGMAQFSAPDFVIREDEIQDYLAILARHAGYFDPPRFVPEAPETPYALSEVYDDAIETLAREAYHRDYTLFGFENWR